MSGHTCAICDGRGTRPERSVTFYDLYGAFMAQVRGDDPVAALRESYATGRIELPEFERRVAVVLRALGGRGLGVHRGEAHP